MTVYQIGVKSAFLDKLIKKQVYVNNSLGLRVLPFLPCF